MFEDFLQHIGVSIDDGAPGRGSGRYPKGSGENPYQHEVSFENSYYKLIKQINPETGKNFTDDEIREMWGMSTGEFRAVKTYQREKKTAAENSFIIDKTLEGWSDRAIGEALGMTEGAIRARRKKFDADQEEKLDNIVNVLKKSIDETGYLDVGFGTATYLGVSEERLDAALKQLEQEEGYGLYNVKVKQAENRDQQTTIKTLCKPGLTKEDVWEHREDIGFVGEFQSLDDGKSFLGIEPPTSIDSSRLKVVYKEDGGEAMDGVIQLRRGVDDISLGGAQYAQVRIAVDDTHYLKGMAIYSDDMPPGVDVIFNTNKSQDVPVLGPKNNSVLKPLKVDKLTGEIDKDNPFGTTLRMEDGEIVGQRHYIDKDGVEKLSPINIVRQEGDWNTWNDTLSSQFLAKQPDQLIKQQLGVSLNKKIAEYNEIEKITQPEVKKQFLLEFAESCDSDASHLKAAALPRQAHKVILPLKNIPEGEIYAPTFEDGEMIALVRHPHTGPFEIPVLKNNLKLKEGKTVVGKAQDAIGIHPASAQILSGADFDGDTVLAIPTKDQPILSRPPLEGLKNFNPKEAYPAVKGMKVMTKQNTQNEMGRVSNLITDMYLKGAPDDEMERAVKHSMVVIDAEKHNLNYKLSEEQNKIKELKTKYQGGPNAGAATLISKSNSETHPFTSIDKIDPKTGEWTHDYEKVPNKYYSKREVNPKTGEVTYKRIRRTTTSTQMKDHKDAYELSSGTVKESYYADYANTLKKMANDARREGVNIQRSKQNSSAVKAFSEEIKSIESKLNNAYSNKPKERKAQILADVWSSAKIRSYPELQSGSKDAKKEIKKIRTQSLAAARKKVGAKRSDSLISLTDREWEAINAGAFSSTKIDTILANANKDRVKQLATPKVERRVTATQIARVKSLLRNPNNNVSDIARQVGVSTDTIYDIANQRLKED